MRHEGNGSGTRRPEQILAEIERTRSEMDATLGAIEQRLTPGQLVDQGLDYLKSSGAKEFATNLGGSVRDNPLPVALVGIGLAWLMASGRNGGRPGYASTSSSSMSSGLHAAGDKAHELKDRVTGGVESARDRMSDTADRVRSGLSSGTERARQQYQRARGGLDYLMNEQPIAFGALGLALGAMMAAAAPRTEKEDELMGEAKERVLDKAKQAGEQGLEKAKEAVSQAQARAQPPKADSGSGSQIPGSGSKLPGSESKFPGSDSKPRG